MVQGVADGNEAKVAELLIADPAVTDMLSCVETASRGSSYSSSIITGDAAQAAVSLHFSWRLVKGTIK